MPLSPKQLLNNRYRVIGLLGQGGFGAVYRVWDTNLERTLSLKENLDTSPEAQRQFKREAQILFDLTHASLPKVIDYFFLPKQGQYLVMEYIEGEDLHTIMKHSMGMLPEAMILPWIGQICDALAYLHAQTPPVIHRDIKPSNIRITSTGRAMLVDFGLAKIYDPSSSTSRGARAVTLGYSPPEQYGLGKTDAVSDIYSLGAMLYHALTGITPPSSVDIISGITPPLRLACEVNPAVSSAVSAAIEKAMALNRSQRWQTVLDFKAALPIVPSLPGAVASQVEVKMDILSPAIAPPIILAPAPASRLRDRLLEISRRSVSLLGPAAVWLRHKMDTLPSWVLVAAGFLVLMLAAFGLSSVFPTGGLANKDLTTATELALIQPAVAIPSQTISPVSSQTPALAAVITPTRTPVATPTLALPLSKGVSIPLPVAAIQAENINQLRQIAVWGKGASEEVAWSPFGNRLAVGYEYGLAVYTVNAWKELWSVSTDRPVSALAYSSDDTLIALNRFDPPAIELRRAKDGVLVRRWEVKGDIADLAFSPDGSLLAAAENSGNEFASRLWRVSDGSLVSDFQDHTDAVTAVAFSPDGVFLASASSDDRILVRQVTNGILAATLNALVPLTALAISPDGKLLVSGDVHGGWTLWDLQQAAKVNTFRVDAVDAAVEAVAFSPDGKFLATASPNQGVVFWDIAGVYRLTPVITDYYRAGAVAFSPDGKLLAAAVKNGSIFSSRDYRLVHEFVADKFAGNRLSFVEDGKKLVAENYLDQPQLWSFPNSAAISYSKGSADRCWISAFSVDGSLFACDSGSYPGELHIIDVAASRELYILEYERPTMFAQALFSPDNSQLFVLSASKVFAWWLRDGSRLDLAQPADGTPLKAIAISTDGVYLAASSETGMLYLWDIPAQKLLRQLQAQAASEFELAFSPDNRLLATGGDDGIVNLWKVPEISRVFNLGANCGIKGLTFSPASDLLAVACGPGTSHPTANSGYLQLWGSSDGQQLLNIETDDWVYGVTFSPDGRFLVWGSRYKGILHFLGIWP